MSPYQGFEDDIMKICLSANELTWITFSSSQRKSDINFAKNSVFLEFAEENSRSNSCKMTIHLLYFPPMIGRVKTY
jgi:hypothetical protein